MKKISVCFKRVTIYFLVVSFLLISVFGNSVQPVRAAACTPTETKRMGDLLSKYATSTLTAAELTEYNNLVTKCSSSIPVITPETPVTTPKTPDPTAPHNAPGVLGNLDKNGLYASGPYKGQAPSVANGGLIDPTAAAPGSDCTAKCPPSKLFSITASIQSAICQMQCTIINWEAGIIGWAISTVLYPALGIPTTPAAAPSGTGGTGATGGTGTGGGGGGGGF